MFLNPAHHQSPFGPIFISKYMPQYISKLPEHLCSALQRQSFKPQQLISSRVHRTALQCTGLHDLVNLSKRGGKDGVFRGLAGLLRGISQGLLRGISRGRRPREIPRSSRASSRKTLSFQTLLLRFTFYFQQVSVLALLKFTDGPDVTLNLLLQEFHSR